MDKKNILQYIVGLILGFILFIVGMLFAGQVPLLTLVGILGLSGTLYFVFRIVTVAIDNQK